ncbi:MAG: hypothetical protein ACF8R7_04415 [Phycisphaerales bacterium JB039]
MTLPLWLSICGYTAGAGALTLIACILTRPGRFGSRRCPGPGAWWRTLLRPIYTGGCGYDLRGLPAGPGGAVRCPECGRTVRGAEALGPAGLRWIRLGAIAFALGALGWTIPIVKTGAWVRYVPAPALALTAGSDPRTDPLRAELDRRVLDNELPGWAISGAAATFVRDLRDDDQQYNGLHAMDMLRRLGPEAIGALEAALHSDDLQQRQLAASVLRAIPQYQPSARMLQVTVEGLSSRARSWERDTFTPASLGRGVRYLSTLGDSAAWAIEDGLRSDDAQQRFACAVAAGFGRCDSLVDLAAPVLIEHLADNNLAGDARVAAPALLGLGEAARPWLEAFAEAPDRQQRDTVQLILLELDGPATTEAERARRRALNHITTVRADPVARSIDDLSWLWTVWVGQPRQR